MLHQSPWAISPPRLVPANAGPGLRSCSSVGEYGVGDHHGDKDNITFFKISWLEMSWVGKKRNNFWIIILCSSGMNWNIWNQLGKLPISANQWCFFRDSWGHLQRNGSSSGRSTPAPLLRQAPTRHVTAVSVLSSTCLSKQPGIWPNLPCFLNLHCAVFCTKWHTSVFHRFHLVSLHRISENNGTSPTSTPWFYGHGTLDARAIITLDW